MNAYEITPIPDTQTAYETMREYFSRPDAVLARIDNSDTIPSCRYRLDPGDPTTPGCAVGCNIPNDLYEARFEDIGGAGELIDNSPEMRALFANVNRDFLTKAQRMHDSCATDPAHFVSLLDGIALDFDLNIPA